MNKYIKKFTTEKISCPVCKSKDCETICKQGMFDICINIAICKKCGFIYLNPRWTKKDYSFFYKNLYDYFFKRIYNYTSEQIKYSLIYDRIKNIMSFSQKRKVNILDIGAGMGAGFVLFGDKYNSNLFAIEPSLNGQKNLKKNGIKILSKDVNLTWKTDKNFDLIIMRHVLEHLLYPKKILFKIFNKLSDNGYLYVAVPNFNCANKLITRDFFRVVHTLYFTEKNFKFILENSGFRILKIVKKSNGEIYSICKKGKKTHFKEPNFNDFYLNKKRLLTLWNNIKGASRK